MKSGNLRVSVKAALRSVNGTILRRPVKGGLISSRPDKGTFKRESVKNLSDY